MDAFSEYLRNLLLGDIQNWVSSNYQRTLRSARRRIAPDVGSVAELRRLIVSGELEPDTEITLMCKPTLFAPFQRREFLTTIIGSHTSQRLGPPIVGGPHPAAAILAQFQNHWSPVAMMPPDDGITQVTLLETGSQVIGVQSLVPAFAPSLPTIPAVVPNSFLRHLNRDCNVTGILRMLDLAAFGEFDESAETFESLRQAGELFFLDLSNDYGVVNWHSSAPTAELWGGLYTSAHLQVKSGTLPVEPIVSVVI